MTLEEFKKITQALEAFWPKKFQPKPLEFLWQRCAQQADFVDMDRAIAKRFAMNLQTEIGDIISGTGDFKAERERKKSLTDKWDCSICYSTGLVSTTDRKGFPFVFRCSCPNSKKWSESIAEWSPNIHEPLGYRVWQEKVDKDKRENPHLYPQRTHGIAIDRTKCDDRIKDEDIPF